MSSRMARVAGSRDSPTWARGKCAFSKTVTANPARASNVATVLPAGPPPMTTTSAFVGCVRLTRAMLLRLAVGCRE